MHEISLHFDFYDKSHKLDIDKAHNLFSIAKSLGIKYFNTYGNPAVYPTAADDQGDIEFADTIRTLSDQYGMQCTSFHFIGSVLDVDFKDQSRIRKVMERSLRINSLLGAPVFVAHPGTFSDGGFAKNKVVHQQALDLWGEEKTHSIIVENFKYFGTIAKSYGIKIAVENIYGGRFYSDIDELINLVNDVDLDNVGCCLDVGHAHCDHVDIPLAVHKMSSKLFELHLHDNNGIKDQHLPIGFGTVNWIDFIQALNDIDYKGTATFEFFRWPVTSRELGIARCVDFWKSIEYVAENGYWTLDWA